MRLCMHLSKRKADTCPVVKLRPDYLTGIINNYRLPETFMLNFIETVIHFCDAVDFF